jgi:hypothetical protein
MKIDQRNTNRGSVLIVAILTITILMLICATSLYITSQNATSDMQTASWQQSLTAAESGVDAAIRALNNKTWTNWISVNQTGTDLPTTEPAPSPSPAASAAPDSSHFNYLPSSALTLTMQGEGATSVSVWVTVDQAGMSTAQDTNGLQWYRIRSTGVAAAPGPARVSNQKLDNDLRKISLRFDRKSGAAISTPRASRAIEVIAQPIATGIGSRGIVSRKTFLMSGNGFIDSFDSTNPLYSTNGQYVQGKRESHGDVGILDSTGSSLANGTYLYGSLSYSGPAVQATQHVQGAISTPFNVNVPTVSTPNWVSGSYSTALPAAQGNVITIQGDPNANPPTGTTTNPLRYQVSSIVLSGKQTINIQSPVDPVTHQTLSGYDNVQIWITDADGATNSLSTSGNTAGIFLDTNASVKFWVQGNISLTGQSIVNGSGYASNLIIYGVTPTDGSTPTAYIAGQGNFIGVLDAPEFNTTYAGNGDIMGAVIARTLTISGNGSLHYDQALSSLITSLEPPSYAFASWFEDNSDPARNMTY